MKSLTKSVPASIVGFAVLIVLMSAGAAQSLTGSNTVTSDDIVDGTIVAADIKTAAIGGRPIVDGSILKADIGANGVGASELDTLGLTYRDIGITATAAGGGSSVSSDAQCESGDIAMGGGYIVTGDNPGVDLRVSKSLPDQFPYDTWTVTASSVGASGSEVGFSAVAVCLRGDVPLG